MINLGPDDPFGGLPAAFANPDLRFTVAPLIGRDISRPPGKSHFPAFKPLGEASNTAAGVAE
jgi:hypothetical protein